MSPTTVRVFAPAKINLTLHVTGQRNDGYHRLDSLVAFATVGDILTVRSGPGTALSLEGPEAAGVPSGGDNLVLRAVRTVDPGAAVELTLQKQLPAASGIGGGSTDAAAAVRGVLALHGRQDVLQRVRADGHAALDDRAGAVVALGADVPMCLSPTTQRARGVGDRLTRVALPEVSAVLVNPRVPVSTPEVFGVLLKKDNPPMPDAVPAFAEAGALVDWLASQRNDLEPAAVSLAPEIGDVLEALTQSARCGLARMSGSGATCFGLYPDEAAARGAALSISGAFPGWWVREARLGDQLDKAAPVVS